MLIGHYGFAFGIKALRRDVPLWLLVVAVLLVDLAHFIFVLTGLERVAVEPGFTVWVPVRPIYYALSHGFAGTLILAVAFVPVALFITRRRIRSGDSRLLAVFLGLAVLSHFLGDFLTHPGTLPLAGAGTPTVGLGLWNYPLVSNAIEILLFGGGVWLFVRRSDPLPRRGKIVLALFSVIMVAFHISSGFVPPMKQPEHLAISMLAVMIVTVIAAAAMERQPDSGGQ